MVRKYLFLGKVLACVSVKKPDQDWVLYPNQVYSLDNEHSVVKGWLKKGLLQEVN
jgi:hypothetical protein